MKEIVSHYVRNRISSCVNGFGIMVRYKVGARRQWDRTSSEPEVANPRGSSMPINLDDIVRTVQGRPRHELAAEANVSTTTLRKIVERKIPTLDGGGNLRVRKLWAGSLFRLAQVFGQNTDEWLRAARSDQPQSSAHLIASGVMARSSECFATSQNSRRHVTIGRG